MKKFFMPLFALLILFKPEFNYAQDKGDITAIGATAIAGLVAGAIVMERLKEEFELFATDYILREYDFKAFELKISGLGDKSKNFDPSSVSVLSFNITPVDYDYITYDKSKKIALLVYLDSGWRNEFGIDITKVKFAPFDLDKWNSLISKYISLASGVDIINNKIPIYEKNGNGEVSLLVGDTKYVKTENSIGLKYIDVENNGISNRGVTILPFKRITGDTYFVTDFSDEYKLIYNERSLGLYLKEVERLVQLKSSLVRSITDFLNDN